MVRRFLRLAISGLSLGMATAAFASVRPGENILLNGRFESDQRDFPPFWTPTMHGEIVSHPSGGPQPGTGYVSLSPRRDGAPASVSVRQVGHKLVAGGRYRLSACVRTRDFKAKSAGIALANAGWIKEARLAAIPEDTGGEWKRLTREFTCFEGESYFAAIFVSQATGALDVADIRLEAVDAKALEETNLLELSHLQSAPRLIPFSPILEKIPDCDRRIVLRFFGKLPEKLRREDCEVVLTADDASGATRAPLAEGEIAIALPDGGGDGILTAKVVSRGDGAAICEDRFRYRVEARAEVSSAGHRRLNNFATEVLAAKLTETGSRTFSFTTVRDGWVYVAVKGATEEASVKFAVDGKPLERRSAERAEATRRLRAGEHELTVGGAADGELVVRQIAEVLSYCPGPSWIPENGGFDWKFQEKYVLPGITTMDGSGGHVERTRERGYEWIGNMAASWNSVDEMLPMLRDSGCNVNHEAFDGVSCDEFVFADSPRIDVCGRGLREYEIRHPSARRIMTWMIGKPSVPGIDHAFFASGVNVSRGNGAMLFEAYCRTKASEREAVGYIDSYIGDTMRRYRDWYPLVVPSAFVVLGNFTQMPIISLQHHPEVDYKYFLDMQMNFVANDPSCRDLGGVGYWGSYYSDEETHRWSFELTRHYVFEGNTNMLSGKYGYAYLPKLVKDGDFRDGLRFWEASGSVRAAKHVNLGSTQRRWGGNDGVGDTYARFTKVPGETASLTQRIAGLVPGRMYRLEFLAFDARDLEAKRVDPKPVGIRVQKFEGVKLLKSQCWRHVDRRTKGSAAATLPRMVINNIVFTAGEPQLELTLSNSAAADGDELGVNFVRITPYLPR